MIGPRYEAGTLFMHNMVSNEYIGNAYIVVESYWTNGCWTYHLYCPSLSKDIYKTELVLNLNYKVMA